MTEFTYQKASGCWTENLNGEYKYTKIGSYTLYRIIKYKTEQQNWIWIQMCSKRVKNFDK